MLLIYHHIVSIKIPFASAFCISDKYCGSFTGETITVLCEVEGAGWLADGAANVWLDGLPPPTALPEPQLVTLPWLLMHVLLLPPLHARQLASTSAPTLISLTSLMADYPGCDDKFAARCGRALRGAAIGDTRPDVLCTEVSEPIRACGDGTVVRATRIRIAAN